MHITWSRSPITKFYTLGGQILEQVKYLGVILSDELNWSPHINSVTTSANSTLGFIWRNLKQCPKDLKELAYLSLVRSKLEYAASVWDPHHTSDTNKLEQVQRRTARFVCNNYSPYSSITQMLSDLGWQQLKDRHVLDLKVSRSKFEIALSREWEGQLTWYKRDISCPFMNVALTFVWPWWGGRMYRIVTWGDFKQWHAVDISSLYLNSVVIYHRVADLYLKSSHALNSLTTPCATSLYMCKWMPSY